MATPVCVPVVPVVLVETLACVPAAQAALVACHLVETLIFVLVALAALAAQVAQVAQAVPAACPPEVTLTFVPVVPVVPAECPLVVTPTFVPVVRPELETSSATPYKASPLHLESENREKWRRVGTDKQLCVYSSRIALDATTVAVV